VWDPNYRHSKKLGKYQYSIVAEARQRGRHDIAMKESRESEDQKAVL
jgi:hypothetical protein